MSESNKKNQTSKTTKDLEMEADVLFQKIYGKWYAFSTVDEECFMTEVSEEEIQKRSKKTPKAA